MLPYDGEPVHAPSTSAWQWDAAYSLYFNPTTQQWAKPRPDGGWDYAGGVATEAESQPEAAAEAGDEGTRDRVTTTTSRSRRAQVGYGDVDEGNPPPEGAPAVPEDQRWPGSPSRSPSPSPPDPFAHAPLLRLVVHRRPPPSVLPPPQSVASLDPAEPVSIGRDKSFERRIRLRELAVSKTHCTLFWAVEPEADDRGYWAVVDNASTHGTFVGGGERGHSEVRLSEPKVASVPSQLHHLECVS
ncbi:hypothetical protein DMC30DRAFT_348699 [Rhodotorula diobovata]|uniref:FHA domain-containing protein n=1 Tax=Rhodotorula diobovata TaxID=5288 RepID=A0A5C5G0D6_9BASI|nr:hypothetical protein DMC30DRAFT_348699 [Rhodotorula diobovata]